MCLFSHTGCPWSGDCVQGHSTWRAAVCLLLWYAVLRGAIALLLLLHELGVIQLKVMWLHTSVHRDFSTQMVKHSFLCPMVRSNAKWARAQGHIQGRGQFSQGSCVPKAELLSHLLKWLSRPACQIAPTATETRWSTLFSQTPTELIQPHWEATPTMPMLSMHSNTSLLSLSFPVSFSSTHYVKITQRLDW